MDTYSKRKSVKTTSGINIVAGVWLIAAPFVLAFTESTDALWNHIVVGLIVLILAAIRVNQPANSAWMSWVNVVLGIWLVVAPFLIGFEETPLWNSVISGIVVVVMGAWSASTSPATGRPHAPA